MTLRHIRIFLAVCASGNNMTKAARSLYLTQPAVSLAVSELESYYGVRLFERLNRRLYLTEAGKRFWSYASHISALFEEMEKGLRDWDTLGVLRVGASITIGSQLLPAYVKAFSERFPKLDVRVRIGRSESLEALLVRSELDLALIEGISHSPNLISQDYLEDSLAVISAGEGPFHSGQVLSPETFLRQRLLLREYGSGTRELFENVMAAAGYSPVPAWEGVSTTALVNAVIQGLGVSVLPRRMLYSPLERGLVVEIRVEGLEFRRKFHIVHHRDKFLTSSMQAFIELCRSFGQDSPLPAYEGLY